MYRILPLTLLITLFALTARSQGWKKGCYYDIAGTKVCGLIIPQSNAIFFKVNEKGSKDVTISTLNLTSYTIGTDSFVVSKNPKLVKAPFLKVAINNSMKLYVQRIYPTTYDQVLTGANFGLIGGVLFNASNTKTYYYFGKDPELVTKLTEKNFVEGMSEIVADKPELVINIKSKRLKYTNTYDIIEYCKTGAWPIQPETYAY